MIENIKTTNISIFQIDSQSLSYALLISNASVLVVGLILILRACCNTSEGDFLDAGFDVDINSIQSEEKDDNAIGSSSSDHSNEEKDDNEIGSSSSAHSEEEKDDNEIGSSSSDHSNEENDDNAVGSSSSDNLNGQIVLFNESSNNMILLGSESKSISTNFLSENQTKEIEL